MTAAESTQPPPSPARRTAAPEPEPMLRVTHVCADEFVSAAVRRLVAALDEFWSIGLSSTIVSSPSSRLVVAADELGVAVRELSPASNWDLFALLRLRRQFRSWEIDLVHVHGARGARLAALAARWCGLPVVRTFDGYEGDGGASAFHGLSLLDRLPVARAVCTTPADSAALVGAGFPRERVRTVPESVSESLAHVLPRDVTRRAENTHEDDFVVLTLSALEPGRGHDVLLEAFARLSDTGPRPMLWIASDGARLEPLDRQRRALGLEARSRFLGRRTDVAELVHAADVVVDPAVVAHAGVGVLEAMMLERAVVATELGGPADSVEPESSGLFVPPRDTDALVAALERLRLDPALRARFGAAGRERVTHGYTDRQAADAHARIYREVVGARRLRP